MSGQYPAIRLSLAMILCGIALSCTANLALGQIGVPPIPASVSLDSDTRLDRIITLDETGIALKELLMKLSGPDLTLTPRRICAELKVQIHLKRRPLRVVMTSLAVLLSGDWKPSSAKTGYEFGQTDAAVLRRRRWWSLFLGEYEQATREQRTLALNRMRSPLPKITYGSANKETEAEDIERQRTRDVATHDVFAQLPATLQEQLAEEVAESVSYGNPYCPDTGLSVEGSLIAPLQDLPESAQNSVAHCLTLFAYESSPPARPPTVAYLRLRNSGTTLRAFFLDASGQTLGDTMASIDEFSKPNPALALDQRDLAKEVERLGRHVSPAWQQLAEFQNRTVWKNEPSARYRRKGSPPPHRAEVLSWLASKADVEFLADYHSRAFASLAPEDLDKPLNGTLKDELDFRAAEQDMSWKRQDSGIFLFRNNRWYRDDDLEVPDELLKKWMALQAEIEAVHLQLASKATPIPIDYAKRVLDLRSAVAKTLTPWQTANGFKYAIKVTAAGGASGKPNEVAATPGVPQARTFQLPFGNLADLLLEDHTTLRFYAALTDEQRLALLGGQLPYASLSASSQEWARDIQPMISIAQRRSNQPVLLGLFPKKGEVHAYIDTAQISATAPNRTGIPGVVVAITSPHLGTDRQTSSNK